MLSIWAERERDAYSRYNGLIVKHCSGWICLTATGHTLQSSFHNGLCLQDLDSSFRLLHCNLAHHCLFLFFFRLCMFWRQNGCLGVPAHLPVENCLGCIPTSQKDEFFRVWTERPDLEIKKSNIYILNTNSLMGKRKHISKLIF